MVARRRMTFYSTLFANVLTFIMLARFAKITCVKVVVMAEAVTSGAFVGGGFVADDVAFGARVGGRFVARNKASATLVR